MKDTKPKGFAKLKDTLAPMSWPDRIQYIWSYYKETILIVAALLIVAGYLLAGMISNRKEIVIGGVVANVEMTEEGTAYITTDYFQKVGGKDRTQQIKLHPMSLYSLQNAEYMEMTYYNMTKALSMMTDREIDYLLVDKVALELFMSQEAFLDLREIFSEEELAAFGDRLIKIKKVDEAGNVVAEDYPIAINIGNLPFAQECSTVTGDVFFGIASNSANREQVKDFWFYLTAWNGDL